MRTRWQDLRHGAQMLRLSALPKVFAKVVANWLIEPPKIVLGPTDRPISNWRRWRNKWLRLRGVVIFWSLIGGLPLYAFVIEPMRLVVRKTTITLPSWPAE